MPGRARSLQTAPDERAATSASGPLVEITETFLAPVDPKVIAKLWIERPTKAGGQQRGLESNSYSFEIEGWAIAASVPIVAVEVVQRGDILWRVPVRERPDVASRNPSYPTAQRSGFHVVLSSLDLDEAFLISLFALLEDGSRVKLGAIRGRRQPLRPAYRPSINPIMITTLGRSGSNALLQLLRGHPQVVVRDPFDNETRVGSYWTDVLRGLAEPASYLRQIEAQRTMGRGWWVGNQMPLPRAPDDSAWNRRLGAEAVEAVADFCHQQVDRFYLWLASEQSKPNPTYFAEKCQPLAIGAVPALMREMNPRARELVLVRDFRDMLCSMLAYNAKLGFQGFGRDENATPDENIAWLRDSAEMLVDNWHRRKHQAHLVRYEDLVLRPVTTVRAILRYLELDCSRPAVDAMLAKLAELSALLREHGTSNGVRASVGRWRRDLSPDLQRQCEQTFRPFLEEVGYELETATVVSDRARRGASGAL